MSTPTHMERSLGVYSSKAHLVKPFKHNQASTACQPTGWVGQTTSWCYLSRASLALHPPKRPPNSFPKISTRRKRARGYKKKDKGSHHGDNPLLKPTGTKSRKNPCQAQPPENIKNLSMSRRCLSVRSTAFTTVWSDRKSRR